MATYFSGVGVFDGSSVQTGRGVLVRENRIVWSGAHARAPKEARAAHEEPGLGATLLPGLIDAHVHLSFDGSADFAGEAAELTPTLAAIKSAANVVRHLQSGVTTVRDLGGPWTVVPEIGRAIEDGRLPGSRVVAAGRALTITGGHGHNVAFAREVDGADGVRRAVREEIRSGATAIKVVATGGVLTPGITAEFTAFTPAELEAAVDEAHSWGFPVAAHAIGEIGIAQAVAAGVDSIEHGSMIREPIARTMKDRGIFHVPTINAIRGILDHPDEAPDYAVEKAAAIEGDAREAFQTVRRVGGMHAAGTDAGTPFNPHGSLPMELVRMVDWGSSPLEVLRAATSNAARLLRRDEELGTIEDGRPADLVLYDGDPIDDVSLVLKPRLVLKDGELVAGAYAEVPAS